MNHEPGKLRSLLPEKQRATMDALLDPQIGDRFTELFSFWVYVVFRDASVVWYVEGNPPITFPEEGTLVKTTVDKFVDRFTYDSNKEDSWLRLVDRECNVKGWSSATYKAYREDA